MELIEGRLLLLEFEHQISDARQSPLFQIFSGSVLVCRVGSQRLVAKHCLAKLRATLKRRPLDSKGMQLQVRVPKHPLGNGRKDCDAWHHILYRERILGSQVVPTC